MIRKITKIFAAIALVLFFGLCPTQASESDNIDYEWRIKEFKSEVNVQTDSDVEISENILVDFVAPRHGIYRTIPYRYWDRNGLSRSIFLKVLSVENAFGQSYQYEESYSGGEINLKIGDPSRTIVGQQTYLIKYRISNSLNYFGNNAEFYFNVNGNSWEAPIDKIVAKITLPNGYSPTDKKIFLGRYGSDDQSRVKVESENPLVLTATELSPGEGLTYTLQWPKEATPKPIAARRFYWWFSANLIFAFPIILLTFLMFMLFKFGVDPKGRKTIVTEFSPPKGLSLLELSILVDEKADNRDFTAIIISLATEGYLKISEVQRKQLTGFSKDFELRKIKEYQGGQEEKKKIFDRIFASKNPILLSEIKKESKLYLIKTEIEKNAFQNLVKKKYFSRNPQLLKGVYYGAGAVTIGLAFFLPALLDRYFTFSATMISLAISAVLLFTFGKYMPQRSKIGVLAKEQIEGFKIYLKTAEKYRMEFYEKTSYFEKYLPYAIVLGVADIWAKKFDDIYKQPPEWYQGNFQAFSLYSFTNNLSSQFSSSIKSAFTSTPAGFGSSGFSAGGGFSGGGFGGGGGGSW